MNLQNFTTKSEEHNVYAPNLESRTSGFGQIQNSDGFTQLQTSDPTTWVNRTPPFKTHDLSPLIGHVTVGGSPRVRVRIFNQIMHYNSNTL